MAFPVNHKTVFVLDQSPNFAMAADQIDFDFHKARNSGYASSPPIVKTMWTCATESVLEYCRIVWDIFPQDKLIQFVVSGQEAVGVNSWDKNEQNCVNVSKGFAKCGRPEQPVEHRRKSSSNQKNYDIFHGLSKALDKLCTMTETQKKVRAKEAKGGLPLINRGRVVLITHLQDDRKLHQLVKEYQELLAMKNKEASASSDPSLIPINQVFLEIVHCHPASLDCAISPCETRIDETPVFSYQVFTVEAGQGLAKKLLFMALCHYQLASTTVTGIPMKEEQNASSSANYDVELFHRAEAHESLGEAADHMQAMKEGCEYKTITLKWCTPRGSTADMHFCTKTVRVTPTDVNSRPSSCLTNFLLQGRSVMLETPVRKSAGKSLSHMLTSHGGEIFIHNLSLTRSILEDPPSISEGPGGRVTDYRITDAGELMKANRLAPYGSSKALGLARARVARYAQYCPLTISTTTIFNMAVLENLQRIVMQEEISEEELIECKKTIFLLLSMENKGDVLPVPVVSNSQGKSKTLKKEEQYRVMFNELEKFLGLHTRTEKHHQVLDCLLECRNKPKDRALRTGASGGGGVAAAAVAEGSVEVDVALRELDKYSAMTEREKNDFNLSNDGCLRSTTESPMSPTTVGPPAKKAKSMFGLGGAQGKSLLDIWTAKIEKENARKHVPFAGQKSLGEKAKLYMSLEKKEAQSKAGTPERPMNTD